MMIDTTKITPEWLAGFFDGEGCVCIQKKNYLRINITQANYILLKTIADKFGASYGPYTKKRTTRSGKDSTVYEIGWYGTECNAILNLLLPLVVVKQKQVELAIEYLNTMVGSGHRYSDENKAKREQLRNSMRELNHAGPFKPVTDPIRVGNFGPIN